LDRVRRWLETHTRIAGLSIVPRPPQQLRDTYLDTPDWRLFRAGFALRMRSHARAKEATLKALASAREDVADRVELSERLPRISPAAPAQLTGPVGTRVRAVLGKRPLQPLFEVRTHRQRFAVRGGGADLGEIALDETLICEPDGGERVRLQRVEVEAQAAELEPLAKLVKELAADCGLRRAPASKFELGLRSMGLNPLTATPAPRPIEGGMATGEAALASLAPLLAAWARHEPGTRLGDDPTHLHALRIAARRMDALLGLFASSLPRSLRSARPKLKGLVRTLGEVRDHDIQLQTVAAFGAELSPAERQGLAPFARHLTTGREHARKRMLQALDAPATTAFFELLARALAQGPPATVTASAPLDQVAPALLRSRFRKLRKSVRRLGEHPAMEDYHAVRRRVKRLRYALEAVIEPYGKPAQQALRGLRRLQDGLGHVQDAHVARSHLAQLAAHSPSRFEPLTLFLMGRLAERQAPPDEAARARIDKAWRKLRSRWKALRDRIGGEEERGPSSRDGAAAAAERPRADG
jgi:CHAD domain-containing protein